MAQRHMPRNRVLSHSARAILLVISLSSTSGISLAEQPLLYNRDVRPILSEYCFACHGPDSAARKADLRLDQRDAAIEMGAIVPGDPSLSTLVDRIHADDPDMVMPPPSTKKSLSEEEKQILTRWLKEGAEYQLHWSFIPPQRPPLPTVKNEAWAASPIDRFILARLEAEGLEPAPPADRYTLARRVSLDLTGLPPSPELVERFVNDQEPHAYERLVDELLASPQWGEHRGRYWLDYARYADTHGIHFDNFREMWSYRDWVIEAFNQNMPYDQFTIENLAGDLLPDATLEQRIGSGFNRCNMTTNEGGIIDEEYLVLYTRDRTETTSQVWLGLTANCAVCHSHKFDPLSQKEFYQLSAFFNNTTQRAKDGNIKDTPPVIIVPPDEDLPRWEALQILIPQAKQAVAQRRETAREAFSAWLESAKPEAVATSIPDRGLHLHAPLEKSAESAVNVQLNGQSRSLPLAESTEWLAGQLAGEAPRISKTGLTTIPDAGDFDSDQPFTCSAWLHVPANDSVGAIAARMDDQNAYRGWDFWVEGRRVGSHVIHRWNDDALKVVSRSRVKPNTWTHVTVSYDGSRKAAGVKVYFDGEPQQTNVQADALKGTTRTEVPFKIGQRNNSSILSGFGLQDLRIYERALSPAEVKTLATATRHAAVLAKAPADRTQNEQTQLYDWWLNNRDAEFQQTTAHLANLEREQADIRARGTIAHVMQEKSEPAMAYVLFRGEYDKRTDPVEPGTPEVLPPFPEEFPKNRLGFAQWLLLPEHPLTARVTVNRFWQEIFGTGLVKTTGDFGVMGELPSHPELLDWLALEFRDSGWNVKALFRTIVLSNTYRQAAVVTPEKLERDRDNRLLSRGPRFRMDAEMVRDSALAASGLLVTKIGGPSVKPYQPPGVWEAIAMNVSNTRKYEPDDGPSLYRRSMYTFWKRMAPPASMDIFNAPNREYCVVRRERTNTPLQALVTLNDEQFVEAARHLATLAIREGGDSIEDRLDEIGMRLVSRPWRPAELEIIRESLAELNESYTANPKAAQELIQVGASPVDESIPSVELAAWTMLCNELMNLDEVLNK